MELWAAVPGELSVELWAAVPGELSVELWAAVPAAALDGEPAATARLRSPWCKESACGISAAAPTLPPDVQDPASKAPVATPGTFCFRFVLIIRIHKADFGTKSASSGQPH
jgi:hypothetical protein